MTASTMKMVFVIIVPFASIVRETTQQRPARFGSSENREWEEPLRVSQHPHTPHHLFNMQYGRQ